MQYFIRDFDEEPSMLLALGGLLRDFDLIVTYNGQAFDLPLVENRSVVARLDRPFGHLAHLDLLFMARRLWRAAHGSCRLTALEARLLRFIRGPDIHGSMIPRAYFDYLRSGSTALDGVFSHNADDILSLAALTIHAADRLTADPAPLDDPLDVYSLARIFERRDRDKSIDCYERALESALPAEIRVRAMERLSILCRRSGRHEESLERCQSLMAASEFSIAGYEGASIYYERQARDPAAASELLDGALRRLEGQPRSERARGRLLLRKARLERKMQEAKGAMAAWRTRATWG